MICNAHQYSLIWPNKSPYCVGPPCVEVLWWISFHVTILFLPLVVDRPTEKMSLWSKACLSSIRMLLPSGESGRYALRDAPSYGWPGLGCSSCRHTVKVSLLNVPIFKWLGGPQLSDNGWLWLWQLYLLNSLKGRHITYTDTHSHRSQKKLTSILRCHESHAASIPFTVSTDNSENRINSDNVIIFHRILS